MAAEGGSASTLHVDCSGGDQTQTVSVEGQIDLATASSFEDAVLLALRKRPRTLILDLSGVVFIDAPGVTSLLSARDLCNVLECRLSLVVGSPRARQMLDVAGVLNLSRVARADPDTPGTVAS